MAPARARRELEVLAELGDLLNREPGFQDALPEALARLVDLLGLGAGWVFLSTARHGDRHHGSFEFAAGSHLPPALAAEGCAPLREGSCECQGRFRAGGLDRGVNMVTCSRLAAADGDRGGLERHASVPLLGREGPVGILNLARPGDGRFTGDELAFLESVGRQLGIAFERHRLVEERTAAAAFGAAVEERRRLTQDLHDALSQLLFAADLQVRLARGADDGSGPAALDQAGSLLEEAQRELRSLVETLRPPDLSAGLLPALDRLATRGAGAARVHLDAASLEPPAEAADALYRTAQEALHNAIRHGRAENVWIVLRRRGPHAATLEVRDDGTGGDPDASSGGLGLAGIRARAEDAGGELEITRAPEGGWALQLHLPWGDGDAAELDA